MNIILIIAMQRSGSTWLFDAIRSHPEITMHPTVKIWSFLGMANGRWRYPGDLASRKKLKGHERIMITGGMPMYIPAFHIDEKTDKPVFYIEKAHPEFYGNRNGNLIEKTKSSKHNVKFIYCIRRPEEAISSFRRYQKRNPKWYQGMSSPGVIRRYTTALESICTLKKHQHGLVVDYGDMMENMASVLLKVYKFLWGDAANMEEILTLYRIAKKSIAATAKDKRTGLFVGRNEKEGKKFYEDYRDHISKCNEIYGEIVK